MATEKGAVNAGSGNLQLCLDLHVFEQLVDRQAEAMMADRGYGGDADDTFLSRLGMRDRICWRWGK